MNKIEEMIRDLVQQIRVRQEAVKALQVLTGDLQDPEVPLDGDNGKPRRSLSQVAGHRTNKPKAREAGKKTWSRLPRPEVLKACAGLSEPFDVKALSSAAGLDHKAASNQIVRWYGRGFLTKAGHGQYKRTAHFPVVGGGDTGRVTIPGIDKPEESLEGQIRTACLERDKAVTMGQERLAKILQDKVDKLQRQLEQQ